MDTGSRRKLNAYRDWNRIVHKLFFLNYAGIKNRTEYTSLFLHNLTAKNSAWNINYIYYMNLLHLALLHKRTRTTSICSPSSWLYGQSTTTAATIELHELSSNMVDSNIPWTNSDLLAFSFWSLIDKGVDLTTLLQHVNISFRKAKEQSDMQL